MPSLAFLVRLLALATPATMRVHNAKCRYKSCIYGRLFFLVIILPELASVSLSFPQKKKFFFSFIMFIQGEFDQRRTIIIPCSGRPNFGAIEIDWDATPQTLRLEARDSDGDPVLGVSALLSDLQISGKSNRHGGCILETSLPWIIRRRLAILIFASIAGTSHHS